MADKPAVLDLDYLTERPQVIINKQPFNMLRAEEVSILEFHRLGKQANKVSEYFSRGIDTLTDEEVSDLVSVLDQGCRFVLRAPDEVHKILTDDQRLQILKAFTDLLRESAAQLVAGTTTAPESTGGK